MSRQEGGHVLRRIALLTEVVPVHQSLDVRVKVCLWLLDSQERVTALARFDRSLKLQPLQGQEEQVRRSQTRVANAAGAPVD